MFTINEHKDQNVSSMLEQDNSDFLDELNPVNMTRND